MLLSALPLAFLTLLIGYLTYTLYCLKLNYDAARECGLPIILLPFDSANPVWMIIDRKVTSFFRTIPFCAGNFTRFNWRGWEIRERYRAHEELGDALLFVTPGKIYLHLCDAAAVTELLSRRLDFDRPAEVVAMLNVFGPNLGTAEGQQWQKHRKITASCFVESLYNSVWSESVEQAAGMIEYWASLPTITSVADDTRTVSLHVMSGAVFGKSYSFRPTQKYMSFSDKEGSAGYGDALRIILDRCIPLMVLGQKNLGRWWLPKSFKELHQATLVFQKHMTAAYNEEKEATERGDQGRKNLMTALVRSSSSDSSLAGDNTLTEDEVYGNIFVYNFAGHDATANSLAFGVLLLSTHPQIQEWIAEEINSVLRGVESKASDYKIVFPQLKRCLAVTYETIRLYTAVGIAKSVGKHAQPLKINGKIFMIPANTMIIPSYSALHTHPRYWGPDSLEFKPSRWIKSTANSGHTTTASDELKAILDAETFMEPSKSDGSFLGWSGGARSCPGRKFSQVEFVGVLVGLFREYKVKPSPLPGETDDRARMRLGKQVQDDIGYRLLLQVLHPEKAVLQWEKR